MGMNVFAVAAPADAAPANQTSAVEPADGAFGDALSAVLAGAQGGAAKGDGGAQAGVVAQATALLQQQGLLMAVPSGVATNAPATQVAGQATTVPSGSAGADAQSAATAQQATVAEELAPQANTAQDGDRKKDDDPALSAEALALMGAPMWLPQQAVVTPAVTFGGAADGAADGAYAQGGASVVSTVAVTLDGGATRRLGVSAGWQQALAPVDAQPEQAPLVAEPVADQQAEAAAAPSQFDQAVAAQTSAQAVAQALDTKAPAAFEALRQAMASVPGGQQSQTSPLGSPVGGPTTGEGTKAPGAVKTGIAVQTPAQEATTFAPVGRGEASAEANDARGEAAGDGAADAPSQPTVMPQGVVSPQPQVLTAEVAPSATEQAEASTATNAHRMTEGVRSLVVTGRGEARLHLDPEHLGEVVVSVRMEDGRLALHVAAASAEAQEAVRAAVPQLQASLEQHGIRLDSVSYNSGGSTSNPWSGAGNGANAGGGNPAWGGEGQRRQQQGGWAQPLANFRSRGDSAAAVAGSLTEIDYRV